MSSECRATVVLMVMAMAAAIGGVGDVQQLQDCIGQLIPSLLGCLEAVQDPTKKSSADCCKGVREVVGNQMKCLCALYYSPSTVSAYGINMTRISEIPGLCRVPVDVSLCKTAFKKAVAMFGPTLDLAAIRSATEDFALRNKIGEGGFGVVYRVFSLFLCCKNAAYTEASVGELRENARQAQAHAIHNIWQVGIQPTERKY